MPIAAGERWATVHGVRPFLEAQAVDILQCDLVNCGGITALKKIAAMADAQYTVMAPHNSNGPVSTAASVHFDACTTNFKIQECFDDFSEPWVKGSVIGVPEVVNGYFELPTGPGLGIELNEDLIAEHPFRPGHMNLWAENWHKRESHKEA